MSQQKTTDRLATVIQALQLRRETGIMTVKRGEGATAEEGTVEFVNGQITEAKIGRRKGSEAVNWLSTWKHCLYTYVSAKAPQKDDLPLPAVSQNEQIHTPENIMKQTPAFVPISPLRKSAISGAEQVSPSQKEFSPSPASISAIPYPIAQSGAALRVIERKNLSRVHRQILLLVDGRRSIGELMRLTGRSYNEVYQILQDLERATVLRLGGNL